MDAYQAGQQLGTLLFGQQPTQGAPNGAPSLFDAATGKTRQGMPYYRTLAVGAQAQNAMQEARANRAKALIEEQRAAERAKLPAAVSGVYTNPAQAALAEVVLGGNETLNLGDLGKLQNPNAVGALGEAATDMNAGNFAGYNQQTALAQGKPYEPVRVVDNTMLPSGVSLGDAAFNATATPVGAADIDAAQARAAASYASAARQRAGIGADKAGNYEITQDSLGDLIRVNKLTGQMTPVTGAKGPVVGKPFGGSGKALTAADSAYIQKLQRAFAAGKSYAQIAAAAQQDGKLDLFVKHFGKQDVQGEGD